jgi:protein-S-isoprenylcysteine O-methyltransferase Ste14
MNTSDPAGPLQGNSGALAGVGWRAAVGLAAYAVLLPLAPFIAAGELDWPMAWALVGLHVSFSAGSRLLALRMNPTVLAERARFLESANVQDWDRLLVVLVALLGPLLTFIVAGLDRRLAWSPQVAPALQWAALLALALGYAFGTWAMVANAFFSAVVRIQEERGHTVVNQGPYRIVRHPAYAGALVAYLTMPLVLGSLWALVPAAAAAAGVVVRTALEDRTLREDLPGYAEYARQTRYRVVPGLW